MRQDAHRSIDSQMISPIPVGLAGHTLLSDAGMLNRALNRWSAKQVSTRSAFAKRGQTNAPAAVSEEEYHKARTTKNTERLLKKWKVETKPGADIAAIREQARQEREQAARDKAAADYAARVAALPMHVLMEYTLHIRADHAWALLKTAEFCASLEPEEQAKMIEKRRTALKAKRK